jgi:hypothetical protein
MLVFSAFHSRDITKLFQLIYLQITEIVCGLAMLAPLAGENIHYSRALLTLLLTHRFSFFFA